MHRSIRRKSLTAHLLRDRGLVHLALVLDRVGLPVADVAAQLLQHDLVFLLELPPLRATRAQPVALVRQLHARTITHTHVGMDRRRTSASES
jgi:hypothetical protein